MKVISIHSHKGGAGKTTLTLMLAKAHAMDGKKVCAVDLDFVGSGFEHILDIPSPKKFLDDYVLKDKSDSDFPRLSDMIARYTDPEMKGAGFDLIFNLSGSVSVGRHREWAGYMAASEPLNDKGIVGERIDTLLSDLSKKYDLVLLDCHPGLAYLSRTVFGMARNGSHGEHYTIFVATANRAHFLGTINELNYLASPEGGTHFIPNRSVLCLNRASAGKGKTWKGVMEWVNQGVFHREQEETRMKNFRQICGGDDAVNYLWLKEQKVISEGQLIAGETEIFLPDKNAIRYKGTIEREIILAKLGK